jgi:YD repeat-containing protein
MLLIVVSPLLLRAQSAGDPAVAPGSPSQAYALTGIDHVNYYNGLNNIVVPIYTVGGRGGASFSVPVGIQRQWIAHSEPPSYYPQSDLGVVLPNFFGMGTDSADRVFSEPVTANGCTATYLLYAAADGTVTYLRDLIYNGQPSCGTPFDRGRTFQSSDGSNLTILTSADVVDGPGGPINSAVLISRDGARRTIGTPGPNVSSSFVGVEDRNGNAISITEQPDANNTQDYTATDGFGNAVLLTNHTIYGPPSHTVELAYPGASSTGFSTVIHFFSLSYLGLAGGESLQSYHALFPELAGSKYSYFNPVLVTSIVLADQTTYSFQYNSYGEVVSLTLPTGAAYTYKYPEAYNNTGDGVVTRVCDMKVEAR